MNGHTTTRVRWNRARLSVSLSVLAIVGLAALPVAAQSSSDAEFRTHMRTGIGEYRAGNLEAARLAFAKAWAIRPDNELAASLAEVEMKLGRYREAAEHWEYYLNALPQDRTEAEQRLAECRRRLGSVRIAVEPDGATVYLNGADIGPAPLRADLWLDPGIHTFEARSAGRATPARQVRIAAGDALVVTLRLSDSPAPTASATSAAGHTPGRNAPPGTPAPAPPADSDAVSGQTWAVVGGSVLTAAAVGVGVGFTLRANAAGDRADKIRSRLEPDYCAPTSGTLRPMVCDDLDEAFDTQDSSRNIALGSFIAAGVLAVGTVITYALWPSGSKATGRVVVAPGAGGDPRGATLRVSF